MKRKNIIMRSAAKASLTILFSLSVLFSGCDSYLDVNDDPDAIQENPGVFLLPSIQISIGSVVGGTFALHGSLWAQYYNQNNTANQYRTVIDMDMRANDGDNMWIEMYSSALSDIQKLKEYSLATETFDPRLNLIATVLESYSFQVLFDAFGQAPYSQAFQGQVSENYNPAFERGEEAYPLLVTAIDQAIARYRNFNPDNDATLSMLPEDDQELDLIFNGNMNTWIAFANSVKLKLAVRNLDYAPDWSKAIIEDLEEQGNYLTADAMLDVFQAEVNKENPLFAQDQNLNTTINLVANRTLSEFWTNNADPREALTYYANTAGNLLLDHGDHKATTATNPNNSNRRPIMDATRPVYFLTTSEIDFFRAELVVKDIIDGDAKALYDAAVKSCFARVGSTAAVAETNFLAAGKPYAFSDTPEGQLRDIGVQKWAGLANVNPYEGFIEVHRLDHPRIAATSTYDADPPQGNEGAVLYLPKNTVLGTGYIRRYLLPESESVSNANFPAQQTRATDKLWWDVN
ncbi:SusD/RagB family nutrient-binding outer membrane lipoprotein [Pseudochryseolinea flava]|nr:SusD/RagB family nutrient-binding outer membrane lipoprotein [Pseudochryseolinea flava]